MKNKRKGIFLGVAALMFGYASTASAMLIDNGDGTITDTSTNLMWLQDLNLTNTMGIDDMLYGEDKDGALLWSDAMTWADTLEFAGYDDWRLSTADASCVDPVNAGALTFNCTGSELGHLYYNSLGNIAMDLAPDLGPFTNIPTYAQFWTATEYDANNAYDFHLSDGGQHIYTKDEVGPWWGSYTNVIAVRSLEPAPVPEPSMLSLMVAGLVGGSLYRRKMKK